MAIVKDFQRRKNQNSVQNQTTHNDFASSLAVLASLNCIVGLHFSLSSRNTQLCVCLHSIQCPPPKKSLCLGSDSRQPCLISCNAFIVRIKFSTPKETTEV